ncbi:MULTISPECIES: precorrin-3B synthase [unclassified Caballeronia]|uniref:precorrin-3B synthase n=1 Tax=unclassified Caballeronia TaxID=2646786 RepID=UPI002027F224|nr:MULTISPECIES: precorrin-3B synthase [unclassified Caballeronia]
MPPRSSACPGLMRIVPARDGALARVRLAGGELRREAAHAVAHAAERCGSGTIEVTNRANLQLRGIRDDAHAELIDIVLAAGLGPTTAGADDIRNVMLSPLASTGTRALAADIVERMQADAALHALSPKFALQIDDGETLAMLDHPHDLWLSALDNGARFAFGFAGSMPHREEHAPASGAIARDDAKRFILAVLQAFLALASVEEHRMRDVLARVGITGFLHALDFETQHDAALQSWRRAPSDATLRLGAHADYVGAQAPLGRLDANTLHAIADLAEERVVMTPWQSVLLPDVHANRMTHVVDALRALGLSTDPRDPFARLIACAGSSGCAKSRADTKADAHRLAALLPEHAHAHLSGCERSCAAAHPVENTLVAVAPGRYDVLRGTHVIAHNLLIEEAAAWLARSHADV